MAAIPIEASLPEDTRKRLAELQERLGLAPEAVIEQAIRLYHKQVEQQTPEIEQGWRDFERQMARLREQPPNYQPGTGDPAPLLRDLAPDPAAAAEWNAQWDAIEQEQKRSRRQPPRGAFDYATFYREHQP